MDENIATATAASILSAEDAAALATGVASNAFGVPDNEGVERLSLTAEGNYPTFEAAKNAVNHHALLTGYAMTQGGQTYKDPRKGNQARKWMVAKISLRFVHTSNIGPNFDRQFAIEAGNYPVNLDHEITIS